MHLRILNPVPLALSVLLTACGTHADPHGEAIFYGREALVGRLVGDPAALPPIATRCSNCHEKDNAAPLTGKSGKAYAPPLDHAALTALKARRGGPPSSYDEKQFCSLLRDGIDPSHIIISTIMPRYEISDGDCARIWRYLESR